MTRRSAARRSSCELGASLRLRAQEAADFVELLDDRHRVKQAPGVYEELMEGRICLHDSRRLTAIRLDRARFGSFRRPDFGLTSLATLHGGWECIAARLACQPTKPRGGAS